jgi:hypothetical protein
MMLSSSRRSNRAAKVQSLAKLALQVDELTVYGDIFEKGKLLLKVRWDGGKAEGALLYFFARSHSIDSSYSK